MVQYCVYKLGFKTFKCLYCLFLGAKGEVMSLDLDPKVVLQHLHELGYRNIAPQQLDEFIRGTGNLLFKISLVD